MKFNDPHIQNISLIEQTITRPAFAYVVALPVGAVLVTALAMVKPELSSQELGVVAAVPAVMLYVLARLFAAFTERPTDSQIAEMRRLVASIPRVLRAVVHIELIALIAAVVVLASAPIYLYLGLSWAWILCFKVGGVLIMMAALATFVGGCVILAIESHAAGGFVRHCHRLIDFVWCLLMSWSGVARHTFRNHSDYGRLAH